jgi:HEAT repeat protein
MDGKAVLWLLCAGLAGAATLMMLGLVARRYFLDRRAIRQGRRRQELVERVIVAIDPLSGDEKAPLVGDDAGRRLLAQIGCDFMDLVRGEDRRKLQDLLEFNGVVEMALVELATGPVRRREAATAVLAPFTRQECRAALLTSLEHDPDPSVRMSAAFALVEWGGMPSMSRLVAALRMSEDKRSLRLLALFCHIAELNPAELLDLAASGTGPNVLILALHALARAGVLEALPLLLEATSHAAADVRAEAYRSLARLGHPAAEGVLAAGLDDPEWPVRVQAAMCAGRIGLVAFTGTLVGLLDDGEWWVRYRAAEALGQMGGQGLQALNSVAGQENAAGRIAQLVLSEREEAA